MADFRVPFTLIQDPRFPLSVLALIVQIRPRATLPAFSSLPPPCRVTVLPAQAHKLCKVTIHLSQMLVECEQIGLRHWMNGLASQTAGGILSGRGTIHAIASLVP